MIDCKWNNRHLSIYSFYSFLFFLLHFNFISNYYFSYQQIDIHFVLGVIRTHIKNVA